MIIGKKEFSIGKRPYIMGILNVTPDSFSDGGMYFDSGSAIKKFYQLIEDGANIIDIGAESTRPGSLSIPAKEQAKKVAFI